MKSGKVVLGLLAGVAAGALAGILFAPAKGTKTRKRILKKGENYVDALKGKFDELLDEVTGQFEKVKEEMAGYAEKTLSNPEVAAKNGKKAEV